MLKQLLRKTLLTPTSSIAAVYSLTIAESKSSSGPIDSMMVEKISSTTSKVPRNAETKNILLNLRCEWLNELQSKQSKNTRKCASST